MMINTAGSQALAASVALCSHPKPAPQFSYTLASFSGGSLKNVCTSSIHNAIANGFTSVSLVPARIFDGQQVVADGTVGRDELLECLENIWSSGLDLVFQPHLESDYITHPDHPAVWRAYFDFAPDANYEHIMFDTFFEWLGRHHNEIAQGDRRVTLVIAAELENSTTHYAGSWWSVVRHLRQKLELVGLAGRVPIGWNPNWWPMPKFQNAQGCNDFRQFVHAVDFVAPSFYGDWSHMFTSDGRTPRGRAQVDETRAALIKRLAYYPESKCSVPELAQKAFYVGEFGVGGDPQHAEQANFELMKKPDYAPKRRAIYSNLIDWAMNSGQGLSFNRIRGSGRASDVASNVSINIWTGGAFDPVGIFRGDEVLPDPEISRMLYSYKAWRCGER